MAMQAAAAKTHELPSSWQALPKLPMRQFGMRAEETLNLRFYFDK
jgi:hypothetical protein